ncbi:hypothetical protein ACM3CU_06630 [Edwardsiella ictaluri]|uniref:hypothetical protein n=1 Tax=Edwardsiella ictaluri TaxID=67780 RepID=UPI0039F737AF
MKLIQTVGFRLLCFLIIYCVCISTGIIFFIRLLITCIYFYKNGLFEFDWVLNVIYSVKMGLSGGIPLGIGCWILSKLDERKRLS